LREKVLFFSYLFGSKLPLFSYPVGAVANKL
jgi:hypothetical protein